MGWHVVEPKRERSPRTWGKSPDLRSATDTFQGQQEAQAPEGVLPTIEIRAFDICTAGGFKCRTRGPRWTALG